MTEETAFIIIIYTLVIVKPLRDLLIDIIENYYIKVKEE